MIGYLLRRVMPLVCAAMVAGVAHAGAPVPAPSVFQFKGTCADGDCTGVGLGTLTLRAGKRVRPDNFISFDYTSNLISFTITAPTYGKGLIDAAQVRTSFGDDHYYFDSFRGGAWFLGAAGDLPADYGSEHSWTALGAVPEPATWGLMIGGFGLAGSVARRRRTAVIA